MINTIFKSLVLACCVAFSAPGNAVAAPAAGGATVSSLQQGLHEWQVLKGRLILVNGTYQDITTYKRSLTFYFERRAGADWLHVPVIDSETERELTLFSISRGEQTIADAIVVARAEGVELVVAETRPEKNASIAVRRYRLAKAGDDNPDGPAYFFKKTSATSYPATARLTVEDVLKKEASAKPGK